MANKWIPSEPERVLEIGGAKLWTRNDVDRAIADEVFRQKVYGENFGEGSVVVDIGAQIGCFSVFAAKKGARVLAFEPDPWNYRMLKKNIALGDFSRSITPFNDAVWSKRGPLTLYDSCSPNLGAHSAVFARDEDVRTVVTAVTLDDIFRQHDLTRIDFLKMDCEGAEFEILRASSNLDKIGELRMECHGFVITKEKYDEFEQFIKQHFHIVTATYHPEVFYFHAIGKK